MAPKKRNRGRRKEISGRGKPFTPYLKGHPGVADLLVILFFLIIVAILFRREFLFSHKMPFGTDTLAAGVMFRNFYANFVRHFHSLPLWEPYLFGGMPFVDGMHGDTFYPLAFLKFFIPIHRAIGLKLNPKGGS